MPDRKFAANFTGDDTSGFLVELVSRLDTDSLAGNKVIIQIKDGATKGQVDKLQAMINLLGVDLRLETDSPPKGI